MNKVEGWLTFLVFIGVALFAVFNAGNVDTLASSVVKNSVGLVSGIATIKQS